MGARTALKVDFVQYKRLVQQISVGKKLPDAVYVHTTALDGVPLELLAHLAKAVATLELDKKEWTVLKFFKRDRRGYLRESA